MNTVFSLTLDIVRRSLPVLGVLLICFTPLWSQEKAPHVISITVSGSPKTNADSVNFVVTFNESVNGVDKTDFRLDASQQLTDAKISGVSGSGSSYLVSVNNIPELADGILSIDLKEQGTSIVNASGVEASGFSDGLYHYVGAAFDVSRAVYAGDTESFSFTNQERHAFSLEFTPDGSKMFVMGFYKKIIFEYTLAVPFDVSTAAYAGDAESFSVFAQEVNPRSISFSLQGNKMFVIGSQKDKVFEYNLSSPYDISTAVFRGEQRSFNLNAQGNFPYSIAFNNRGTKLFMLDLRRGAVLEYHLSMPFEVSTAQYAGDAENFLLNVQPRSAVSLKFNPDGTKAYVLGVRGKVIKQFMIKVPFDISTAQASVELDQLLVEDQDTDPRSVTFNGDGTKMFVLGNGKDRVLEYSLSSEALTISALSLWKVLSEDPADTPVEMAMTPDQSVKLSAKEKDVIFQYGTNSIMTSDQIEFQSILEGAEEYWSAWTQSSERQFDRLPHGDYVFKLKARNRYGQESTIEEVVFSIQAPWYLTVWAYIFYVALFVAMVWHLVKFNTKRLEREKKELEKVVSDRTEEILKQKDEIALQMQEVAEANVLIKEQADRLQELDKVKSRFFANISHELRTPLTLINAPLESLIASGKVTNEEALEILTVARRNGDSLLSLVEEILDLTKLEAGKLQLIENPIRLSEFLEDTLRPYRQGFKDKSIDFKLDFKPKPDFTIQLDANHASKIINNLLSNALKFTPKGGAISCEVRFKAADAERMQLSVSDTGEGIHPSDLPHIFDRFYQSEQPEKKAAGGTGIGLALAKELAHLFEGTLEVKSELGRGSCFTFEFPFKEVTTEVVSIRSNTAVEDVDQALKETIQRYTYKFEVGKPVLLVTEDHPEMRNFISQTLQPYFEIRQAENGKVAMEILKSERVDIVVSDVMMPVMDGFELLEAIKADESLHEVSLIMLTARAEQEDKLFALTMGIDDYLTKPFNASEFLARIKNILENRIKILRELKGLEPDASGSFTANSEALIKTYDLSEREIDVIRLITKRYSNPEIAAQLHVSRNTVKTHLKNIYSKLDISSRTEVTERLIELAE